VLLSLRTHFCKKNADHAMTNTRLTPSRFKVIFFGTFHPSIMESIIQPSSRVPAAPSEKPLQFTTNSPCPPQQQTMGCQMKLRKKRIMKEARFLNEVPDSDTRYGTKLTVCKAKTQRRKRRHPLLGLQRQRHRKRRIG
jgi:hypothetical protein